ncbi:hypothetical protein NMY22_g2470 [Coprinellus aureogranulatus]|nr:hypothetical protein NMY22_g2470 [Coprinellus aureogranulatus]
MEGDYQTAWSIAEIQDLVLSLGNPLPSEEENMLTLNRTPSGGNSDLAAQRKRALTDTSALNSVITELNDYADPLRNFSRSSETAIIGTYEAKTLFGNIDNLLPVNEAFLTDLEKMLAPNGANLIGGVGDVCLKHFLEYKGFEQYKHYYAKREEAQTIFEREMSKRGSRFLQFIEHIKYQSTDPKNRVGLRELLMEPVQRIPRYTLLFRTMLKYMGPDDPQRAKLIEADEIASKIAQAEADDATKQALIMFCLTSTIENCPANLFSHQRRFIDYIDVEDVIGDPSAMPGTGSPTILHCTLFLFDDKLVIAKRSNGDKSGRALAGLDNMEKISKTGTLPKRRHAMSCKGVLDVTDVVVSDPGGAEINVYLESPPTDQSERWSGRPNRHMVVVTPPMPANMDPVHTESVKRRFLENLWQVQAKFRAKAGQSVVLCSEEMEVETRANRTTLARTYYNVYTRTAFLQESKKTKAVVHIDPEGTADPVPFGMDGPPYVRIRLQPIAGGLCRFAVSSSDPEDEAEEDIVQLDRVPSRIVQTIHQFGLFQFRTGSKYSVPGTPTSKSRASIFGLDTLSRNLFSGRPGSAMGDFFGGTITNHKRTKSATSRASILTSTTQTTATADSLFKSGRTNSTAATSVADDASSYYSSQSSKRKVGGAASESGSISRSLSSLSRSLSRSASYSRERDRNSDYSDVEDEEATLGPAFHKDNSDYNLQYQLELARHNSLLQHAGKPLPPIDMDQPVEDTIYEEAPPEPVRKKSTDALSLRHLSRPSSRPESPAYSDCRPDSRQSMKRPSGPRSPSPLPPARSSSVASMWSDEDTSDPDSGALSLSSSLPVSSRVSSSGVRQKSRSKRENMLDMTPRPPHASVAALSSSTSTIEPLSIKKKMAANTHASHAFPTTPTPRRTFAKGSPLTRPSRSNSSTSTRRASGGSKKASPTFARIKSVTSLQPLKVELVDSIMQNVVSAKDDIESSHRAVRKIKVEVEKMAITSGTPTPEAEDLETHSRPTSPEKVMRTPPPHPQATPLTKEAQARLEEMKSMIMRRGETNPLRMRGAIFEELQTPRSRDRSGSLDQFSVKHTRSGSAPGGTPPKAQHTTPNRAIAQAAQTLTSLSTEADDSLVKALRANEALQRDLKDMSSRFKEKLIELERMRLEIASAKRQTDFVKQLLADATAEKELMYEAFNEELDMMCTNLELPDDEKAWPALVEDLKATKVEKNQLEKEKTDLERRLAESEHQCNEYAILLRHHGLLP